MSKKKIVVLGGAGFVGRVIVKELASITEVEEVCVADYNEAVAQKIAEQCGSKVVACKVDINDENMLRQVIEKYDVVANTVGPFYKNGPKVLKVCMAAKKDYVDVTDDYDATELMLSYDDKCKQAGIKAIICCGVSPGITNMLGLLGAEKMDKPEEIHTAWVQNVADATGEMSWWHAIHMSHGDIPQYFNGEWGTQPALTGKLDVEFAAPLGRWPVYYLGHPEPVTLPRYIKGLSTVTNRGNVWPQEVDLGRSLKPFSDLGLTGTEPIVVNGVEIAKRDFIVNYIMSLFMPEESAEPNPNDPHFCLRVDVLGKTGDIDIHYAFTGSFADTTLATGLSAAYGAQMLAQGEITTPGIFAPEGCLSPVPYFEYLNKKGFVIQQTKTIVEHTKI